MPDPVVSEPSSAAGPPAWLLDLDGVIWRGSRAVDGSEKAVAALRGAGRRVGFATNNSFSTVDDHVSKLSAMGITATAADLVTSAMALCALIEPGERALVCGGPGVVEALEGHGVVVVDAGTREPDAVDGAREFDVVVVGFHRTFDYRSMTAATGAVLAGARLVATNDDPLYPTADGFAPGCGAILASIERATRVTARVAGKPTDVMGGLIISRFGHSGVFVGDSLATDGAMAAALGWPFGLVLSGNTDERSVPAGHPGEWVAPDLAGLVEMHVTSACPAP